MRLWIRDRPAIFAEQAERGLVAGRWLVEDGAVRGLDLTALKTAHSAAAKRFLDA